MRRAYSWGYFLLREANHIPSPGEFIEHLRRFLHGQRGPHGGRSRRQLAPFGQSSQKLSLLVLPIIHFLGRETGPVEHGERDWHGDNEVGQPLYPS